MTHVRRIVSFITVAVAMSLGAACSASAPVAPDSAGEASAAADLVGRWRLVQTCGGLRGSCTPGGHASEAYQYAFTADGTVDALFQGEPAVRGTYRVSRAIQQLPADLTLELRLSSRPPRLLRMKRGGSDVLLLTEPYPDGFSFEYRRER
jgi:hypothetical protein